MKMNNADLINCERCDNSLRLCIPTIPATVCNKMNSCGVRSKMEQSIIDTICAMNAVRESRKMRIIMGSMAKGTA